MPPRKKRVTLAQIAARACVHTTTVSLALRNNPRLPIETRERLQALAREMGYAPDPWLQALVSYRSRLNERKNPPKLAYITNWNTRWGWKDVTAHPDFYKGAEEKAHDLGFSLEHFWMREPGLTHTRLSEILKTRGIFGLIVASHVREIDDVLQFDWASFSAVKIDFFPHEPQLPVVTNNHFQIVRLAMQKAKSKGYRRIAFVMDEGWDISVDHLWSAGFLWEQQSLPKSDRIPAYLFPNSEPLDDWLRRNKPDVVISKSEFVIPVFESMGRHVPDDIAFIDIFLENNDTKYAGVKQSYNAVGALAVEILAGQMQQNRRGIQPIPTQTCVEGIWYDGASLPDRNTVRQSVQA
jgi:LacI family transcriptional regulator